MSERQCGGCTRCCYVMNVPEYNSPSNNQCRHCEVGKGCSNHNDRHDICRAFSCLWLAQPQIPESLRPDKCHILFELPAGSMTYVGYVDQDHPTAYENPEVRVLIQKITEAGHPVLLYSGENKTRLFALPDGWTEQDVKNDINRAVAKHFSEGRI